MFARAFDIGSSLASSSLAAWKGTAAFRPAPRQPEQMLVLYEFEACPYCRLVREALTELDLDALIKPCPKRGQRYREEAQSRSGHLQFPLLIDPNTDTTLLESQDIIDYLYQQYGQRKPPQGLLRRLHGLRSQAASLPRLHRGMRARHSRSPELALELYSFESSPFSRLVRERLCELELAYILRNMAKARWEDMGPPEIRAQFFPDLPVEGRNRLALLERTGKVQVPYLIDPNTGMELFESDAIITYLEQTYAVGKPR